MADHDDVEVLRCSAMTHAKITDDRRYVRIRCHNNRCPDYIYAKEQDMICIHVWDLHTPPGREIYTYPEFEYQSRKADR